MSYVPRTYTYPNYLGDATPTGAMIVQMGAVPDAPGSTGVISAGIVPPFASTIDPAITLGMSCVFDAGVAALAASEGRKIPIMITPYTYDGLNVTDPTRELMARKGYAACIPVTRGRGFSTGSVDDSGRELYDFKDCIAAVAAAVPITDGTIVDCPAWSGGAANLLALFSKYPGLIRNTIIGFGWGDYGENPAFGRSFWGNGIAGYQALMTTRIGDRVTQIERYRARCIWQALPYALRQSSSRAFAFSDHDDLVGGRGAGLLDMRTVCADPAVQTSRWQVEESDPASPVRWVHGLPETNPDLFLLMNLLFARRDDPGPSVASVGDYYVPGHIVHGGITPAWELWTAPTGTASPRLTSIPGGGGCQNIAFVKFNATSGLFYVTPLDGPCAVEVLWNGISKVADITGETLFDMAN